MAAATGAEAMPEPPATADSSSRPSAAPAQPASLPRERGGMHIEAYASGTAALGFRRGGRSGQAGPTVGRDKATARATALSAWLYLPERGDSLTGKP